MDLGSCAHCRPYFFLPASAASLASFSFFFRARFRISSCILSVYQPVSSSGSIMVAKCCTKCQKYGTTMVPPSPSTLSEEATHTSGVGTISDLLILAIFVFTKYGQCVWQITPLLETSYCTDLDRAFT